MHIADAFRELLELYAEKNSRSRQRKLTCRNTNLGRLGLLPSELGVLIHSVRQRFVERVFLLSAHEHVLDRPWVWNVAKVYQNAIRRSTEDFTDLLVQVMLRRVRPSRLTARTRVDLLTECLKFGFDLSRWELFRAWFDQRVTVGWLVEQGNRPVRTSLWTVRELIEATRRAKLPEREESNAEHSAVRREFYEERLFLAGSEWLGAIDSRIELQCVLASRPDAKPRPTDKIKAAIHAASGKNPNFTQREIAGWVDDFFSEKRGIAIPILNGWRKHGSQSMVEAFDNRKTRGAVKKFISTTLRVTKVTHL